MNMATKQKLSGAYFTPEHLVAALSCWAVRSDTDRLLDPSCGDGRFIASHHRSVGIEQDPNSAQAAVLHAPWALVHEGDFFEWAGATDERFECCAGNPPFVRYQNFKGAARQRALSLCSRHGANFSGLTSTWAPFLVAAASLLKRGGRMAFVVPAEIGHAPYAAPLVEYLAEHFSIVHIIAVREKLFPELSEDCWLLYAEGFSGSTTSIRFTAMDRFQWSARPPASFESINVVTWRERWNRRLRPLLLPERTRELYLNLAKTKSSTALGDFADIGIGYVSGANNFFHLKPSEVVSWRIPKQFVHPTVRNGKSLPCGDVSKGVIRSMAQRDEKFLLLRLQPNADLPNSVRAYLDSDAGCEARMAYKCRTRAPWYAVPDVRIPHFMLSYMSGRSPSIVRNSAGATCTNSLHALRIRDESLAKKVLPTWSSEFSQLSCEIEGHPLGGGMLKLEVREASKVRLVDSQFNFEKKNKMAIRDGLAHMRRWRHHASENL